MFEAMNSEPGNHRLRPPATIAGRVVFALFCLVVAPPAATFVLLLLFVTPNPTTIEGWAFRVVVETLCTALTMFSIIGLIWAIFISGWAERLLERATRELVTALFWFCMLSLPFAIYALFAA